MDKIVEARAVYCHRPTIEPRERIMGDPLSTTSMDGLDMDTETSHGPCTGRSVSVMSFYIRTRENLLNSYQFSQTLSICT